MLAFVLVQMCLQQVGWNTCRLRAALLSVFPARSADNIGSASLSLPLASKTRFYFSCYCYYYYYYYEGRLYCNVKPVILAELPQVCHASDKKYCYYYYYYYN